MGNWRTALIMILGMAMAPWAAAQPSTEAQDPIEPEMTFVVATECESAQDCRKVARATGYIAKSSPQRLKAFIALHGNKYPISFDSRGGSLGHGLHLGALIRQNKLNTELGEGRRCWSACAYAFLGGVGRMVGINNSFGIHQFAPGDDVDITGPQAITFAQSLTSHLRKYATSMNVDPMFVDWASAVPASSIRVMPRNVLIQWNVDNSQPDHGAWELEPFENQWLLEVVQQQPRSDRMLGLKITPLPGTRPSMIMVGLRYDQTIEAAPTTMTICRSGYLLNMGHQPCRSAKLIVADNKDGTQSFLALMDAEQLFVFQQTPARKDDTLWVRVHQGERTVASGMFSTKKFDEYLMLVRRM